MVPTSSTARRAGQPLPPEARPRPAHRRHGARAWPRGSGGPIVDLAQRHTTVSVERATLRLAGLGGADPDGVPWVNLLADAVRADVDLAHGLALPVWDALLRGEAEDLLTLAQKAAAGSVRFRLPEGDDARDAPGRASRSAVGGGIARIDVRREERERLIAEIGDAPRQPWIYLIVATGDIYEDIPQAQQAAREGADVIAVIRSTGQSLLDYVPEGATRDGLRRHLRHPGELPADAGRARRDRPRAGPLHPADQLRQRSLHARDRGPGRPRAARHDAQRLDVRDPLPRHQPGAHLRRPALQPPGPRPRRDHHQHRRGQLPHHRRRGRGGAHGHHQPAAQRVLRPRGRARGLAARPGPRLRDRPRRARLVPARAGPRAAGPRAVPRRAAEVDAADPAHDRRRLPRLPARRLLQPGRGADRAGHPARRDDDRGRGDAVALRPRPGAAERPLRHGRRRQPRRGLPPRARRRHRASAPAPCWGSPSTCWAASPTASEGCSTRSPTAPSG